ncbi:MAG: zf-HC2 domain-containing protein [Myxococcales bacterium]
MTQAQAHPYSMDQIVLYHDGEMAEGDRAPFELHLAGCRECQRRLDAATVSLGALDEWGSPPPLDMEEAMAALRRGAAEGRAERARRKASRWLWLVAAAAVAGAAAYTMRSRPPTQPRPHEVLMAPAPP